MNKKFSTLVAVLLAAGAWTTLDAKVVKVTTPAAGNSYLVGTGINQSTEVEYTFLLNDQGKGEAKATDEVTASSPVWTLVVADGGNGYYSLQQGSGDNAQAFYASTTTDATLTLEKIKGSHTGNAEVLFVIDGGKLKVANNSTDGVFSSNTSIKGQELYLTLASTNIATLGTPGSAIDFGLFVDEDPEGVLPGFDLPTNGDGEIVIEGNDFAGQAYNTPVYFKVEGGYLAVENGKVVKLASKPTAAQSLSASWLWQSGKLISVAAQAAGKTADKLQVKKGTSILRSTGAEEIEYQLGEKSTTFSVVNGVINAGTNDDIVPLTGSSLSVSVGVPAGQTTADYTVSGTQANIVSGTYELKNDASGYSVVMLKDASGAKYLKAGESNSVASSIEATNLTEYQKYLWRVEMQEVNGQILYSFTSMAKDGNDPYKWTIGSETAFEANEKYSKNGITLTAGGNSIKSDGTAAADDPAIITLYNAFDLAKTQDQLNSIYNPGFAMTVKLTEKGKETIEDIDVLSQKMYPFAANPTTAEANKKATTVKLWDNPEGAVKGAKLLALNMDKKVGTPSSNVKGQFVWVTPKEIEGKDNYKTDFQFHFSAAADVETANISEVYIEGAGYLYVFPVQEKYYLTTTADRTDDMPYIKLGGSNIYDVKKLLGKLWNISYADTKANATSDNEYKVGGILTVTNEGIDYVASSTVAAAAPEAQWLVTSAILKSNTFTLTNREDPTACITGIVLREVDGKFIASAGNGDVINGDLITLTESKKKDNFEGYMQTTEYTLRSNNYYLGQYHAILGNHNAYFIENHANSHQIGAVAEKEDADKWKLHFAMKLNEDTEKYSDVDTVKIITEFATLNADGDAILPAGDDKAKADTLYILPYAFQKVANREFVAFNPENKKNFDFYACDENVKVNPNDASRFALKVKPNGYNFVEISANNKLSNNKVYLANSAEGGSLKQMATYAADQNSIMVVEPAEASEYHKIAAAWGDTIKLFRDENNDQVLYEKRDKKSVVEKDTLSFLNIDNTNQFTVNPAIFADTAYINRVDANGVQNACYQYLLAVNVDPEKSYYCPYNPKHNTDEWREENGGPCADAKEHRGVYGRFLVNLIDTANVYGLDHIHANVYINDNEAGDQLAKLSFVEGYHADDTLAITRKGGEVVKIAMDSPEFNIAKFAFRYVDSKAKTFKIQTQFKPYYPSNLEWVEENASNDGYLKWINGTVVVAYGYENGDVFGIEENYEGNPTANDEISAAATFSVATIDGAVVVKGAEGKNVVITNVLGQTVASTVITSSEATIAVPAGVVVVAVEGETAVKAIVK